MAAMAGTGVTVAIVDSGVDGNHPDLPHVSGGLNCVGDEVRNDPAAAQNWRPALSEGEHGTHVAGIIGGRGNNFRGVAPGVTLRSYRCFRTPAAAPAIRHRQGDRCCGRRQMRPHQYESRWKR